jgi:hypothetical protein
MTGKTIDLHNVAIPARDFLWVSLKKPKNNTEKGEL